MAANFIPFWNIEHLWHSIAPIVISVVSTLLLVCPKGQTILQWYFDQSHYVDYSPSSPLELHCPMKHSDVWTSELLLIFSADILRYHKMGVSLLKKTWHALHKPLINSQKYMLSQIKAQYVCLSGVGRFCHQSNFEKPKSSYLMHCDGWVQFETSNISYRDYGKRILDPPPLSSWMCKAPLRSLSSAA